LIPNFTTTTTIASRNQNTHPTVISKVYQNNNILLPIHFNSTDCIRQPRQFLAHTLTGTNLTSTTLSKNINNIEKEEDIEILNAWKTFDNIINQFKDTKENTTEIHLQKKKYAINQ